MHGWGTGMGESRSRRIVVVGSGGSSDPIPREEGDAFYAANSSLSRLEFDDVTHVISTSMLYNETELRNLSPQPGRDVETSTKNRLYRTSLVNHRKTRKAVVVEGDPPIADWRERLIARGYSTDVWQPIDRRVIENLTATHLGRGFLLSCWRSYGNVKNLLQVVSNIVAGTRVGHHYRPSTGVLCLLLAVDENGRDAEYVLKGINSSPMTAYGSLRMEAPPNHLPFDQLALDKLKKTYRIRQE